MAGRAVTDPLSDREYSVLLDALSATQKGRLFLEEYRHRNRPYESTTLMDSLKRIESIVATLQEELRPAQLAEELRRVGMTIEIALDGVDADPEGSDAARRFALIGQARAELAALASSLAGRAVARSDAAPSSPPRTIELTSDHLSFLEQLGLADQEAPAER
jgi:hypothetical protein